MNDTLPLALGYISAFIITCVIEVPVVYILFRKAGLEDGGRMLKAGFIAQVLTHPVFFIIIPNLLYLLAQLLGFGDQPWIWPQRSIVWYEMIITVVEGFFYLLYLKPVSVQTAFFTSIAANALSWGLGSLIPDWEWILSFFR